MARTPSPQPTARACHPHAERRNCNFLEFTNRPSTPKPPPKAHRPPLFIHNQSDSQRQWITFHLICVPRARARGSKFHAETNFSGNRGAAKANELLPTPRPISTTYQHSLSTTQPSLGTRTARAATERPNQQICRVADHQARPVPELPWGEPGLDCGRFLRLDMPQNRHEEPFPAHMAMK